MEARAWGAASGSVIAKSNVKSETEEKPKEKTGLMDYEVQADGRVAGTWRKKGEIIQLSAFAAKYENVKRTGAAAKK